MKTRYLKIDWLIPVLGIAVVVGSLVAGTAYLNLERKIHANEALTATLDRLYQDHQLSVALKTIHNGAVAAGTQRLDLLLCGHILTTNSELGSADPRTRTIVEDAFRKIARIRPKSAHTTAAASTQECSEEQAAAERILELASASDYSTQMK